MINDERLDEIILSRPYPFNFYEAREMAVELRAVRKRNRRVAEAVLEGDIRRVCYEWKRSYLDENMRVQLDESILTETEAKETI